MAYVLTKAIGDGTDNNRFRLGFPTYVLIHHNPDTGLCLADIDITLLPRSCVQRGHSEMVFEGVSYPTFVPLERDKEEWERNIRTQYAEGYSDWDASIIIP